MAVKKAARNVAGKKKAAARSASERAAPGSQSGGAPKQEVRPEERVSSMAVNRAHLFALRPRVSTAFRQEDFMAARRLLEGETYKSIEEAARAVAERALALSNDPKEKRDFRPGR
jgi:hypothetical protein